MGLKSKYLQRVTLIGTDDPIRGRAILVNVLHELVTLLVIIFHDGLQGFEV